MLSPKISIILAVYNEIGCIESALESSLNQTYHNRELVVIDGGSNDGTKEYLESRKGELAYFVSEPDSGIYSAWNKALMHSTGDFVCFVGADDIWASATSLENLVKVAEDDIDLVSAKFRAKFSSGQLSDPMGESWSWTGIRTGMNLCHRGMLHRRQLFINLGGFDPTYKIAGDYEFLLRCGSNLRAGFLDEVTIIADYDGISFRQPFKSLSERCKVQLHHRSVSFWSAYWTAIRDYVKVKGSIILRKFRHLYWAIRKKFQPNG